MEENEDKLHQCQTFRLNDKIHRIARDLADFELLAKLSEGDMIATDAKYDLKCLTNLYNRHRSFQNKSTHDNDNQKFIEGKVFTL